MEDLATGLHTPPGASHPGIFIENDDAIVFGKDLDKALSYLEQNAPQTVRAKVLELRLLLGLVTK